jgi:AraC-like DNA-binding protein
MRYAEHTPSPVLRRHVECYWTLAAEVPRNAPLSGRVLPDGCMDILFHLGDPVEAGSVRGARSTVVGSMTRAVSVRYGGSVELVGIRFRPGGATPFLGLPAFEITDGVGTLEGLWGDDADRLWNRLAEAGRGAVPSLLDAVLGHRLARSRTPSDERVLRACERIAGRRGNVSVDRIAADCGLGRRQLERRFLDCVGLSPKATAKIARFRALVGEIDRRPASLLSRLAHQLGYSDHAHMTRDFRTLADTTPSSYRRERSGSGPDA